MKKEKKHAEPAVDEQVEDTTKANEAEIALAEKQKQNDELLDKLQRNMAEFDNFRKRTAKEKSSMYDEGVKDTFAKILPVIDNFERALNTATSESDQESSLYKGLEMILKQLGGIVLDLGVEAIPAVGEKFDPNNHFAVAHIEDENYEENTIIEELQRGYRYKDKVVRASMVKVAN